MLILDIIWIVTGVLSLAGAIKVAVTGGGINVIFFILMAIVSFVFALIRHNQRKKS